MMSTHPKNNKRVLIAFLLVILAGYAVLDRLTKNYVGHVVLNPEKCESIDGVQNPKELEDCLLKRQADEASSSENPNFLAQPDFNMEYKVLVAGKSLGTMTKSTQENLSYFDRIDDKKLVLCSSNLQIFTLTKGFIRLLPNLKNGMVVCADKETKELVVFAPSSMSDEMAISESKKFLGDLSEMDLSQMMEFN